MKCFLLSTSCVCLVCALKSRVKPTVEEWADRHERKENKQDCFPRWSAPACDVCHWRRPWWRLSVASDRTALSKNPHVLGFFWGVCFIPAAFKDRSVKTRPTVVFFCSLRVSVHRRRVIIGAPRGTWLRGQSPPRRDVKAAAFSKDAAFVKLPNKEPERDLLYGQHLLSDWSLFPFCLISPRIRTRFPQSPRKDLWVLCNQERSGSGGGDASF